MPGCELTSSLFKSIRSPTIIVTMSSDGEEVEASEDTNGGRESVVSFDVNGDGETILDYSDHFVKSYKSHDAQSHDSHSHNEGRDRLGPMEGDNQAPKPLPNASMNVTQVHSRRVSHVRDLTTGKQGGVRAHKALVSVFRSEQVSPLLSTVLET